MELVVKPKKELLYGKIARQSMPLCCATRTMKLAKPVIYRASERVQSRCPERRS